MERVLHIVDSMGMGGIQAFIMNAYRNIDRNNIQFDFLLHQKFSESYDEEIKIMGGEIFYLPPRSQGIKKNRKALDEFFKSHNEYRIVHQHESSLTYLEPLIIAKKNKIPKRIIHSHSTRASGNKIHTIIHKINRKRIKKIATDYIACGSMAAKWMYSDSGILSNVIILNNGIDVEKFTFNKEVRCSLRDELNLHDKFVIGHIGRFSTVKNHTFLIDIFKEYSKKNSNAILLLVGDGELKKSIESKVRDLLLDDKVLFLGVRKDINSILQVCDYIVIPSLYEGFPVTAVEAIASGLPILMSNTITRDVLLKDNCKMLDLHDGPNIWANTIKENERRIVDNMILTKNGFDIKNVLIQLMRIYKI